MKGPAPYPCASCPYRKDCPSGVWAEEEYDKLPPYDGPTHAQPISAFMCHQQNGHLCAGWAGCHDMAESMALRIAALNGGLSPDDYQATVEYDCPVPLFESGAEAAAHGLAQVPAPGPDARRTIDKLTARRERRTDQ